MSLTRRQREILDYITGYLKDNRYAPSLEEIAAHFKLSSLATVHSHLKRLEEKSYIRRGWNLARCIEVLPEPALGGQCDVPMLGFVAAGSPIEPAEDPRDTVTVPESMLGKGKTYVLRVQGSSMIDEHIQDGDLVIVDERNDVQNGDTVIALLEDGGATLKKFYREGRRIRLQPANSDLEPLWVRDDKVTIQGRVIGIIRKY
ncbi:transcriptional repressor LexA [Acidobacteriota bacterium]